MASLNKWIGLGNVGSDPDLRMTGSIQVANFGLAVTDKYKNKDGEYQEKTEWINISSFGKLAEIVDKYVTKGAMVYVEGKLKIDKYTDKNGNEKISPKIVAENIVIVNSKKEKVVDDNIGNKGSVPAMMDDDIFF